MRSHSQHLEDCEALDPKRLQQKMLNGEAAAGDTAVDGPQRGKRTDRRGAEMLPMLNGQQRGSETMATVDKSAHLLASLPEIGSSRHLRWIPGA